MLASQAEDHLRMSRGLSEKQKLRDGERLESANVHENSGYLRAMALDAKRGILKR
jgi:hypothetical protein